VVYNEGEAMSLDSYQRTTVERIREFKGKISLSFDDGTDIIFTPAFPDERFNKDIAIALQGYFARMNDNLPRYTGD